MLVAECVVGNIRGSVWTRGQGSESESIELNAWSLVVNNQGERGRTIKKTIILSKHPSTFSIRQGLRDGDAVDKSMMCCS